MKTPFLIYTIVWGLACLLAIALLVRGRSRIELFDRRYWLTLSPLWKIAVAVVATVGFALMAPYTGDPTWDYIDATYMSVLTVATAPWSVAIIWRFIRGRRDGVKLYLALCLWMFSSSWSYDLYLVLRDGFYPLTWLPNIFASSLLYFLAGMLWSLEWREGRGTTLVFLEDDWPAGRPAGTQTRLLLYTLPLIVMVVVLMAQFVIDYLGW